MTRKWIALPLLLLMPIGLSAQSFWDGDAAIQRGDATFESGSYAASNSFSEGTQVVVQDLDTGKSTTVTVSSRISGQSNLLMMLSPKAAQELGMQSGAIARVRVTLVNRPGTTDNRTNEQTLSRDPDINPAAAYAAPTETQPAGSGAQQIAQAGDQTSAQGQASTQAQAEAAGQPGAGQQTDEQRIIAEAQARTPQKELYLPPREDQKFALQPTETGTQGAQGQPEIASVSPETATPSGTPAQPAATSEPAQPEIASVSPESVFAPAGAQTGPSPGAVQPEVLTPGQPEVTSVSSEAPSAPAAPPGATEQLAEATLPAQANGVPVDIEGAPAEPSTAPGTGGELVVPEPLEEAAVPASPVQTEVSSPTAVPPSGEGQRLALLNPEAPQPGAAQAPGAQGAAAAQTGQTVAPATGAAATAPTTATTTAAAPTTATTTAARPATTARPQTPAAVSLPRGAERYFLQLAAFGSEKPAQDLAAKLSPTYPTLVVAPSAPGASVFRVLVGPLNRAESGAVLVWFRNRGYRDAFLKQE